MTTTDPTQQLEDALFEASDLARALDAVSRGADVGAQFVDGSVPLTRSVLEVFGSEGSARCVRALLDKGARVADETSETWGTSVHHAAELGYVDALAALLAADGKAALQRFDELSRSPLICAVTGKRIEAAQLLLDAGADINASDEPRIGNPPVRWAAENGDEAMVRFLLHAGANPLKPGWMQASALDIAKPWKESTRHPELKRIFEMLDLVARKPESRHGLLKREHVRR